MRRQNLQMKQAGLVGGGREGKEEENEEEGKGDVEEDKQGMAY